MSLVSLFKKKPGKWLKNCNIYQIFVGRQPGSELSENEGQVFKELAQEDWKTLINKKGFNVIYLMGVFDNTGPIIVEEEEGEHLSAKDPKRQPSPFAISDHTAFNPKFGSEKDFKLLVAAIHKAGGRVIVDFVPNHTATNHPWIKERPHCYVPDPNSPTGLLHEFSGDVVKLNYSILETRRKQRAVLRWINALGVDGVRCDMAHLVPLNFWKKAIRRIKKINPDFVFIAEAYSDNVFDWSIPEGLVEAGFYSVYHEFLYRNIKEVFIHGKPIDYLAQHVHYVVNYEHKNRLVHYLANHDDPLPIQCRPFQEALMVLLMFMPGTTFVYNGQLNGMTRRLKHHSIDILPEELSELGEIPEWFKQIVRIKKKLRPVITSIKYVGRGFLECVLDFDGQEAQLVLNLTTVSIVPDVKGKGVLHLYEPGDSLPSGQAELYV